MLRTITRPLPEGEEKTALGTDLVSARRSSNSSHFDTPCCSFHNKELDPPTHCACGSSSVNESLKYLLTSLRLPSIVVILTRWWFLFVFVHHFGIVLRWAIVVAALLRKRATRDQRPSQYRQQNLSQLNHNYFAASLRPLFHA